MKELTRKFAAFLSEIHLEKLPVEVIEKAKDCLLDYIGVCLVGSSTKQSAISRNFISKMGSLEEATVLGSEMRSNGYLAAFANAVSAHCLELDDGNRYSMGHPGCVVISSCLAVAEMHKSAGRRVLEGIIAGYETFGRVASAINPSHYKRGFHTTGTVGTIAACASVSRVMDFSIDKFIYALGLSASMASGIRDYQDEGTMTKCFHAGWAAKNGILAASLAESGFTSSSSILEGKMGFPEIFSGEVDYSTLFEGLGEDYHIMKTYFKFHASCRHTHPAIDAVLEIRKNPLFDVKKISCINVYTYSIATHYDNKGPKSELAAKMSLPYSIAVSLIEGKAGIDQFSQDYLKNQQVLKLINKINLFPEPKFDSFIPHKRIAKVEVVIEGEKTLSSTIEVAKGEPENVSREDIQAKFRSISSIRLTKDKINEIERQVENLEHLDNIHKLITLLKKN